MRRDFVTALLCVRLFESWEAVQRAPLSGQAREHVTVDRFVQRLLYNLKRLRHPMRLHCHACVTFVLAVLRLKRVLASDFGSALDLIVKHHGSNAAKLGQTLETLTKIATKLKEEPQNKKYRSIRLLNKTFWECVGRVNGGIPFMTALGFDLVEQGASQGPSFQVRAGAPHDADLEMALTLLSAKSPPKDASKQQPAEDTTAADGAVDEGESMLPTSQHAEGFNPFATAFSRKSRTQLQQRAEEGLANWTKRQAKLQQCFTSFEDRNVTILLPQAVPPPRENDVFDHGLPTETESEDSTGLERNDELEIVMRLWRERHAKDDPERFETHAAKKLRMLRATKTYPYVLLRVRLPEGLYLQARFNLDETLETVYQVIGTSFETEAGADSSNPGFCHKFELFLAPPTRILERGSTSLRDARILAPACVLHLRWDDEQPGAEHWGRNLEEAMGSATVDSRLPRLPYSSRHDVPEPISARRARYAHAEGSPPDMHDETPEAS